jgi:hypothetical protein
LTSKHYPHLMLAPSAWHSVQPGLGYQTYLFHALPSSLQQCSDFYLLTYQLTKTRETL